MRKSITGKIFRIILFVLIFALLFMVFQNVISMKWANDTDMYKQYAEQKDVDIVFCGASNTYTDMAPSLLWHETGITSFDIATSNNSPMLMYYELKYAFKHNVPKLVVLDISGMVQDRNPDEDYETHEWTYRKVASTIPDWEIRRELINDVCDTFDSMDKLSFYLPLLRYHSRWTGLSSDDFYHVERAKNRKGSYMRTDTEAQTWDGNSYEPFEKRDATDFNMEQLDRVVKLCKKHGCKVMFIYYPKVRNFTGDVDVGRKFAKKYNTDFLYFKSEEEIEEVGLDLTTDYYDWKHMNVFGQKKFTKWFAAYLEEHYDFASHEDDQELCKSWDESYKEYVESYKQQSAIAKEKQEAQKK